MSTRTKKLQPELKEFAAPGCDLLGSLLMGRRLSDHIVRSEGFSGHASSYGLFEEMEDKDPHLFSVLQTRKLGVLARPRRVESAGDGEAEAEVAAWVGQTLQAIPGWQRCLSHLLGALGRGLAVVEVLWGFDGEGRIVPRALKPRSAGRFVIGADGQWRLLEADAGYRVNAVGRPLPGRKFLIGQFGESDERPYGKGLCEKVYWYWWFKKNNLKFWLIYNEKFGTPTVVARHRSGLGDAERDRLLEVIDAIQTDAGVTIPEGVTLELLEARRAGSSDTYRELASWCDEQISRAVLGQTLTVSEGNRSGSLALGQVHESVRMDYMKADAWMLMDIINSQLVRWMVDLNFGENQPAPRWTIDLAPQLDLVQEVEVDRQLLQMGVSLPVGYFYEKYGRPSPTGEGHRLQYDDSNLYQYHLQFGVLTINEVRAKLGLSPVSWGERSTSPVEDPVTQPTPGRSTGEDPTENDGEGKGL